MHAIESKDNFSKEVSGMLVKIKDQIDTYSNSVSLGGEMSNKGSIDKLNVLKKYDYLLKPFPGMVEGMDQEDWEANKEAMQKTFVEAQDALVDIVRA